MRAWDLPTRLFHWTLVVLLVCAWASFEYAEQLGDFTLKWHRWNGYAILVLLVFRVLWGFVGSSTSRFSAFVRLPNVALGYGLDLVRGRDRPFLGHNPLGSWMIVALLVVVAGQAVLGLFTVEHNDSGAFGPLYRLVSDATWKQFSKWHLLGLHWVILPLVGLHIAANLLYGLVKKDPLIRAMITGTKPAANYEDQSEAVIVARPLLRATACLVVAAVTVFGTIAGVGGRLL